ncbi:Hypothetical_protein [Hexamita inflata]|uniref:Hypothetical_protein n=1 Tax=Hexamita inflata TaxID=28002 RepID=A0AA86R338_9EUKA|nr:Hypothetical protein HINF_LOCUS48940 [Hexamita inflata]
MFMFGIISFRVGRKLKEENSLAGLNWRRFTNSSALYSCSIWRKSSQWRQYLFWTWNRPGLQRCENADSAAKEFNKLSAYSLMQSSSGQTSLCLSYSVSLRSAVPKHTYALKPAPRRREHKSKLMSIESPFYHSRVFVKSAQNSLGKEQSFKYYFSNWV